MGTLEFIFIPLALELRNLRPLLELRELSPCLTGRNRTGARNLVPDSSSLSFLVIL